MGKINIGTNVDLCPMPVTRVGATVGGKANFMTVAWVTRVNLVPSILAVALNKPHYTPEGIRANGTFSVDIPDARMVDAVDYCGLVSGRKTDKSEVFEIFYGQTQTAPMISPCPLCFECKLTHFQELPTND